MSQNYGTCRSCRTLVFWTKSAKNDRPMPLEADDDRGNVVLDGFGRAHAFRDHAAAEEAMEEREDLPIGEFYISHHAVCPRGQEWQGKRRGDIDEPAAAQGALDL